MGPGRCTLLVPRTKSRPDRATRCCRGIQHEQLRFTTDHEWLRQDPWLLTVGITIRQDALGDVVFDAVAGTRRTRRRQQ